VDPVGTGGVDFRYFTIGYQAEFTASFEEVQKAWQLNSGKMPVVLVVEDEPLLLMAAVAMVDHAGFEAVFRWNNQAGADRSVVLRLSSISR
jgi:hypothetical protein